MQVSYYTVTILQMADIPLDEHISAILVAAQVTVHSYHTALLTAAALATAPTADSSEFKT